MITRKGIKELVVLAVLAVLLFLPVLSHAQTTTPTPLPASPPISHIVLTASASGFKDGTGSHPASIAFAGLQLTKTISLGYEQLTVSGEPVRGQFGIVTYSNTLDRFVGAKVTSHFVFDATNIVVTVGGGAGKWLTPQKNSIAETFHASLTYPLAAHVGWQLFGYQLFHSANTTVHANYTQTLSTGPVFYF